VGDDLHERPPAHRFSATLAPAPPDQEARMPTIQKDRDIVTLINVFTVKPGHQQQLVEVLIEATKQTMKDMPGFISANIHKSFDGTRVVNYAQWRSREDFQAMTRNPKARPHMEASAKLAEFDPILCEVVESFGVDEPA
jgi:heme-degrading monooxygenase HmoA